ncbi:MAG: 3-dehydroquinate synthase [Luteolibacter sp.]
MSRHEFSFSVSHQHRIVFTHDAFNPERRDLAEFLEAGKGRSVLVCIEQAVADANPGMAEQIRRYLTDIPIHCAAIHLMPGGEPAKNGDERVKEIWEKIADHHIDRHSYLIAIGGGAFLDVAGYAAATAHRGIRLIRFPTTTLAQGDSGVGVKCAINVNGRKNWAGAFAVPYAVINDFNFLQTQPEDSRRAGLVEAIKVALVKDRDFFKWIESHSAQLMALDRNTLEACVERSALLHAQHITGGGDPFESGSSRPLDFGHWAAHKLESMTQYELSHDRAVAIGIALDVQFAARSGLLDPKSAERVQQVLAALALAHFHPALDLRDDSGRRLILDGLDEFREHLGGELTVLMPRAIGQCEDVHSLDEGIINQCIEDLRPR